MSPDPRILSAFVAGEREFSYEITRWVVLCYSTLHVVIDCRSRKRFDEFNKSQPDFAAGAGWGGAGVWAFSQVVAFIH